MPAPHSSHKPNACGTCTACCVYLPISAGHVSSEDKPAGVSCQKLCAGGCSIYARRPKICADFCCAWLRNEAWPDAWRPDASGLLCLWEKLEGTIPSALVYEIRAGSLDSPTGRAILAELRRTTSIVVVVDCDENRTAMPGDLLINTCPEPIRKPHMVQRRHETPAESTRSE